MYAVGKISRAAERLATSRRSAAREILPTAYMRLKSPCQVDDEGHVDIEDVVLLQHARSPDMPWQTTWFSEVQIASGSRDR